MSTFRSFQWYARHFLFSKEVHTAIGACEWTPSTPVICVPEGAAAGPSRHKNPVSLDQGTLKVPTPVTHVANTILVPHRQERAAASTLRTLLYGL